MIKITLPFVPCTSVIPIVKFTTVDGKEIYAIVDSGSESTLINKTFKKDFPGIIQSQKVLGKMTAIGIGGEKEMAVIEAIAQVPAKTDKGETGTVEITGLVEDLSTLTAQMKKMHNVEWIISMLIGGDTLSKLTANIEYKKKNLTLYIKKDTRK